MTELGILIAFLAVVAVGAMLYACAKAPDDPFDDEAGPNPG